MSAQTDKLDEVMAKAIAEINGISKSETANTGKFNYKYATLDNVYAVIRDPLKKHEITVEHHIVGEHWLLLYIAHKGQYRASSFKLIPEGGKASKNQDLGTSVTYMKRYSLSATFRIATDEDKDGVYKDDSIITKEQFDTLTELINTKEDPKFVGNDIKQRLGIDTLRIMKSFDYEEVLASLQ